MTHEAKDEITYTIRRDGEAWCATRSDFVDLQESEAGFGQTPEEALARLVAAEEVTVEDGK